MGDVPTSTEINRMQYLVCYALGSISDRAYSLQPVGPSLHLPLFTLHFWDPQPTV